MDKKKYEWKMPSFAKGISPQKAAKEIDRIRKVYGAVTPEHILKASEEKDSLFHELFTWDNDLAANQYRLQQARNIINNIAVTVITDGQEREVSAYEMVSTNDLRQYKSVEDLTQTDIEQLRLLAVKELNLWKNKLNLYTQFSKATKKLDEAVTLLN